MRTSRMKVEGEAAVYHCISRIVGGDFLIDDQGKERFRQLMWRQAAFCGVQIITYCVMSNHVHILLRVPVQPELSDKELLNRASHLYDPKRTEWLKEAHALLSERKAIDTSLRDRLLARMGDLSVFMKELKHRFTNWHNRRHKRFGTLWAQRFRSLLVEDDPYYIGLMAAYIDLNPVRADLVSDPKDYRFCGYAEALAGGKMARRGIQAFARGKSWRAMAADYRTQLFVTSGESGRSDKVVLSRDEIKKVVDEGGKLSTPELLRLRIRYLTDGAALGSQSFIAKIFETFRDRFSDKRQTGPRPVRRLNLETLYVGRDLQTNVLS